MLNRTYPDDNSFAPETKQPYWFNERTLFVRDGVSKQQGLFSERTL